MTQESHRRIKLLINAVREIEEFDFPFKATSFSVYPASSINAAIVKIAFFSVAGKSLQALTSCANCCLSVADIRGSICGSANVSC